MVAGIVMESTTVECVGIPLSKIIGLHLITFGSQPFPVNLVQVVRLKDTATDNASSWRGLDNHFNMTEHDIPFGLNQWGITTLGHSKPYTILIVRRASDFFEFIGRAAGEVESSRPAQRWIGRTR